MRKINVDDVRVPEGIQDGGCCAYAAAASLKVPGGTFKNRDVMSRTFKEDRRGTAGKRTSDDTDVEFCRQGNLRIFLVGTGEYTEKRLRNN
ncbi:MAG: hypothetical protein C0600_12495 [Ignavibacteria bacterium]|nr:MAG: hypothetical protein C0600_12495 [Ignavibacteria bacterium]